MPDSAAETRYLHAVANKPDVDDIPLIPVEMPTSRIDQGLKITKYVGITAAAVMVYEGARFIQERLENYGR